MAPMLESNLLFSNKGRIRVTVAATCTNRAALFATAPRKQAEVSGNSEILKFVDDPVRE